MTLLPALFAMVACVIATVHTGPVHRSPPSPFPSDGDDLDTVVCQGNAAYQCLYLVNQNIDWPVYENKEAEVARATKKSGERISVIQVGGKATVTGRCGGHNDESKIHIDFGYHEGEPSERSRAYYDTGFINAQFCSNWDNVLSANNREIHSDVGGDDLRIYCTKD